MLYKLFLVLASILTTLAQMIIPAGVIAPTHGADVASSIPAAVPLERIATVGQNATAVAPLNVLWVNINGERATQDTQGQGNINDIEFEVGVHPDVATALLLGQTPLPLAPTDVVTVRQFTGSFLVRTGTLPSLTLDGQVQATFVNEGNVKRIATQGVVDAQTGQNLAYVELGAGRTETTVQVSSAGQHVVTGPLNASVSIPVSWVRVNDKTITDYTFSDGFAQKIEFLTRPSTETLVLGSGATNLSKPVHELLTDFVGSYFILQSNDGSLLLKLDGYASNVQSLPSGVEGAPNIGIDQPIADFSYAPLPPTTSDVVQFADNSTAGSIAGQNTSILLWQWSFGDGGSSSQQNPQHRYARAGVYPVTLTVTDTDLAASKPVTKNITVLNSPPVAEFDFSPKTPTDLDTVQFTDMSWDVDSSIAQETWDFGDNSVGTGPSPTHHYADEGAYTVRLTVVDGVGLNDTVAKIVPVTNVAPQAQFGFAPANPNILSPTTFTDLSTDPDGHIVDESWTFGDNQSYHASGPTVNYQFTRIGTWVVSLTVKDDDGQTATSSATVDVQDIPPTASFQIVTPPANQTSGQPIAFRDTSTSDTGRIQTRNWNFSMGSWFRTSTLANPNVTFPSHGIATVTLNVTDPFGLSGQVSETFTVLQGPPQANYVYSPLSPLTFDSVNFQSTSSDPEGTSAIANYAWWIPSLGQSVSSNRATSVTASWKEDGLYAVFLNVSDNAGHFSNVSRNVFVSDRKPTAQFTFSPSQAAARSPLSFHGTALDADGTITKVVWAFGDGTTLSGPPSRANLSPTHTYSAPGQYVVSLVAFDDDSSASPTFSQAATITPPPPLANFTWSPVFPTPGEPIQFQDTSATQGTRISQWNWQFGDGQSSSLQNPQHGFSVYGPEPVSLTVTDDNSPPESDTITKTVIVNAPPVASFTMGTLSLARPSSFTSTSTDADDSIANWTWRFGDGAFGWGSTVSHTYTQAGAFTVTLFVTDTRGATSSTSSIAHIVEVPPAISFSVSPTTPVTNAPVLFAGQASDPEGSSMTFSWSINAIGVGSPNVGSGSTQNLSFTFTSSGIYLVSFTVQDAFGGQSTTSQAIRVVSSVPKSLEFLLGNPDGTPFNLSSGAVVPSGTLTAGAALPAIALPARALAPQPDLAAAPGGLVALTLPAGSWAAGDLVNLEFYGVLPKGQVGTFQDTLTASPTELAGSSCLLALQAVVTVTVHPPTSSLGVVPAYPLGGSDVVRPGEYDFANPTEPVVVTLSGHWQGTTSPTVGVPLYTETVYTALHSFDFRNSDPRANSTASLLRLVLPEVSGITNRTGQVDLVAPPFVGFVPSAVAPSNDLYLPGWYYMQAQVQFNGYHPVGSVFPGVQHWFEDPDGALEPVASGT